MLIVTTENVRGYRVAKVIGLVFGVSVRSRSFFGDMLGSIKAALGGRQAGYVKMISENRTEAVKDMIWHAERVGANAIVMARFDSNEFGAGRGHAMNEVVAYGTAVVLKEEDCEVP
jgi:uncharacterized protein YbjQ (UPF0145 family)